MSLKAKLEAVIYAAEEPVTLAQLASLFASEALEWKAEQETASETPDAEAAETQPMLIEQFVAQGPVLDDAAAAEAATASDEATAENLSNSETSVNSETASEPAATAEAELEARRKARQLDRELRAIIRQLLDELIASYASDDRGIEIREIAGGYRMATKPEYHDAVRLFVRSLKPALKLSLPALETLAVIAYKQPVTAPEVNEIRGVDSSGVFGSLLARKLITSAGRKQVIGRPILYKTTREFLLRFGLRDVSELPSMEEFEKLAAIELDEPESGSFDEAAPSPNLDPNLEFDGNGAKLPISQSDAAAEPEISVASDEESPAPMPAVTAAQKFAETPAGMAADPSAPTETEDPAN